jgi:hypothetical protein
LKFGEGGFCILETKHGGGMGPRLKLFHWTRRLQNKGQKHRKTVLGSISGEDGFCSSETKHDRRTAEKNACFGEEITGTEVKNPKTVPGSSLGEMLGLGIIIYFFCDIQRYISND